MKIKLTACSTNYGDHKLKEKYIKAFNASADFGYRKLKEKYIKAFNAKESKTEDDYGHQIYTYDVEVSSIEKLFKISKKINQELIISPKDVFGPNRIEIYDGYHQ